MAVAKCCPPLTALLWWDRKPVHLLCTGGSKVLQSCAMMRDYQRWMGGVDIHDQLRLQRYSLQMAVVFRKYYKTIFLGLVDMAIMNAYIVYREAQKQRGEPPADHAKFLRVLQGQMLELTPADFTDATWRRSKKTLQRTRKALRMTP
uniref:PiggyBac transposable element-derived protein domain-containing protein n=1 Tax=Phytophthora ramorum TaxID=164328 RepID=H3HA93_PHYRM